MKNLIIAGIFVLAFSFNAFAKIAFVPLDELIKGSDLIVVGTLTSISEKEVDFATRGTGKIVVEQVIAGDAVTAKGFLIKAGDRLELKYVESFACVMGSHKAIENEKGIFFLNFDGKGEIQSATFRSLDDLPQIKNLLKKGINPQTPVKTVGIGEPAEVQEPKAAFYVYEVRKSEVKLFSPALAFLVFLSSILLYWVLYRSRFKIR